VRTFLARHSASGAIIIPLPIASRGRTDWWTMIVQAAAAGMEDVTVLPIINRVKAGSTRQSVAQVRRRIVAQEYGIDDAAASLLAGRRVFLLDDNVTTGTTMLHAATLLRRFGPAEVVPAAIERQVSARVLQRCPPPPEPTCPHHLPTNAAVVVRATTKSPDRGDEGYV
jgi:hypothetical protein